MNRVSYCKSALVALSAAALTLSAAVVSDAGAASPKSANATTTVVIGAYSDQSATNSLGLNFSAIWGGASSAARAINKAGIPNHPGVKIKVVTCDTQENPNQINACGRQFVSDGAVAVVGSFAALGSPDAILQTANIPNVTVNPLAGLDFTSPISFPLFDYAFANAGLVKGLKKVGAKSTFVLAADTGNNSTLAAVVKSAGKTYGLPSAGNAFLPPSGVTDFTSAVTSAMQSGADSVIFLASFPYAIGFIKTAQQLGYHPYYAAAQNFGTAAQDNQLAKLTNGKLIEYGAFPPLNLTSQFPTLKTFKTNMAAEYKAGDQWAAPSNETSYAIGAWLGVHIVSDIIAKTSPGTHITPQSVLASLNSGQGISLLGLGPNWEPTNVVTSVLPRISWPYVWLDKVDAQDNGTLLFPKAVNVSNVNYAQAYG
jgi:ABC-type branched-subunit amino acid transport system substrate-binding protein